MRLDSVMSEICPIHGNQIQEMALGRLDDEEAQIAESSLASCADCGLWWKREIANDSLSVVDDAVAGAIDDFELPRRASHSYWVSWAAAAVLAIAVGVVLQVDQGPGETAGSAQPESLMSSAGEGLDSLVSEGFEREFDADGAEGLILVGLVDDQTKAGIERSDRPTSAETIFADGMEAGELVSWSDES